MASLAQLSGEVSKEGNFEACSDHGIASQRDSTLELAGESA